MRLGTQYLAERPKWIRSHVHVHLSHCYTIKKIVVLPHSDCPWLEHKRLKFKAGQEHPCLFIYSITAFTCQPIALTNWTRPKINSFFGSR